MVFHQTWLRSQAHMFSSSILKFCETWITILWNMKNIFQQMEASGVLPDDDYKQPLSTWSCFCKRIIGILRFPFCCICFCILAEVDDHWKHQFSRIGILGEENAPRVLLLFEHSNGNQIFGKVSIHDLGKCNPRVSLLFEHSNKNQVALKVSIHDLGELFVFFTAWVKDRF